jgi:hypothetical protein
VKYFLRSYRALNDSRRSLALLKEKLEASGPYLSDCKILWIATCTILRTSIDLFKVDSRSCLAPSLREEFAEEWRLIGEDRAVHSIYWDFIKRERDQLIHQYDWRAYEAWIAENGETSAAPLSLLRIKPAGTTNALLMSSGSFKGMDSIGLLERASDWAEERIFSAIQRAGYQPDEERNLVTFEVKPAPEENSTTILGQFHK